MEPTGLVLPTQGPLFQPTPVTMFILSCCEILAKAVFACEYAAAHAPVAVGLAADVSGSTAPPPLGAGWATDDACVG